MFISVNLFTQRASSLQLIRNVSIYHNHSECRQRLIQCNFVYKICSKAHLSLDIYLTIQNIQGLNSSTDWFLIKIPQTLQIILASSTSTRS